MSADWPKVQLGDILKLVSRPVTVEPNVTYRILGAHWYAQGLYTKEVKNGSRIRAKTLYRVEVGDFVYNRLFAWKGSFAIATDENDGCHASNEFPCFSINRERVDGQYLWRYFSRASAWNEALGLSTGGTPTSRNRLKENKFLAMKIPLPPLDEQRRTVARIEELAARIEEVQKLRRQAAEEAEALFNSEMKTVFSSLNYDPRTFGSFEPHVTSGPRNWGARYSDKGLRFYRAQDIGPNGDLLNNSKIFIVPPETRQGDSARLVPGDLMMVITGATVGRCTVFTGTSEPGYVNQHVAIWCLPPSEVDPYFALWGLRSPVGQEQLLGQRYGQGKPGLNLTNIRKIELPFPPIDEQRRIVARLDEFQAHVDGLKKHQVRTAEELDALLPAVLDRAFRGQL